LQRALCSNYVGQCQTGYEQLAVWLRIWRLFILLSAEFCYGQDFNDILLDLLLWIMLILTQF